VAEGSKVVCIGVMTGTHDGPFHGLPATHRPTAARQVHVLTFNEQGLITEHLAVRDDVTVLRQLGALPHDLAGLHVALQAGKQPAVGGRHRSTAAATARTMLHKWRSAPGTGTDTRAQEQQIIGVSVSESRRFLCHVLYSAELAACREISAQCLWR
jgi:SnoaL-like polyketide cyclase